MTEFIQFRRGGHAISFAHIEPAFAGNSFLPQHAIIPLSIHSGSTAVPVVANGDFVQEGQILARSSNGQSINFHASVPGIVDGFITAELPGGHIFNGVHIKTQGAFALSGKKRPVCNWQKKNSDELIHMIENAGLVNTVDTTVPLASALRTARTQKAETIHAVLYDQDPTAGLDSFLAARFLEHIAEGIALTAKILNAASIQVSIPANTANKEQITRTIQQYAPETAVQCTAVSKKYPALPLYKGQKKSINTPAVFEIDAAAALSLYECIVCNHPMLHTYILLTGKGLKTSKVFKVRIGTSIANLIKECGGFKPEITHIIVNGLIQGTLTDNLDLPVGKGFKSIHAVDKDFQPKSTPDECQNCGLCLRSCPMYLDPIQTVRAIQKKRATADSMYALNVCKNCSCCSMVCPSRIPLSAIIQTAAKQGTIYAP